MSLSLVKSLPFGSDYERSLWFQSTVSVLVLKCRPNNLDWRIWPLLFAQRSFAPIGQNPFSRVIGSFLFFAWLLLQRYSRRPSRVLHATLIISESVVFTIAIDLGCKNCTVHFLHAHAIDVRECGTDARKTRKDNPP